MEVKDWNRKPLTPGQIKDITEKPNKQDWNTLIIRNELSEEFLTLYYSWFNNFSWDMISSYQTLSESFIRKFLYKLNFDRIVAEQKLSKEFIIEFSDKINWFFLQRNKNISDEVKELCKTFL
jgi:hypothetical protein